MAFPLTFFNSPVAQCQPARLQWAGGQPPYAVAALDARFGGIGGALIAQVVTGAFASTFQWDKAALPADALIVFQVQDSTGKTAQTNPIFVADSDDTSCLPASLQPAPTATFSTRTLTTHGPSEYSATTTNVPPGTSQTLASAPKSHSGPNTGLILAVVGCSIVTLAIVSALWYWHLSRRKSASLVSRISPPVARAETPMWGNMSATRSDLKLADEEITAGGYDSHPQQYQPQSIVPLTSLPPPPTQRSRPQPRLADIDITAAYSYPVSPPLYSPPPPGGLTPMPPPRPSTRGTRSGAPRP